MWFLEIWKEQTNLIFLGNCDTRNVSTMSDFKFVRIFDQTTKISCKMRFSNTRISCDEDHCAICTCFFLIVECVLNLFTKINKQKHWCKQKNWKQKLVVIKKGWLVSFLGLIVDSNCQTDHVASHSRCLHKKKRKQTKKKAQKHQLNLNKDAQLLTLIPLLFEMLSLLWVAPFLILYDFCLCFSTTIEKEKLTLVLCFCFLFEPIKLTSNSSIILECPSSFA